MLANQEQSKKNIKGVGEGERKGGYMALLHRLEEQFYGPETNKLSASAFKVLLYIRHRTIRDWVEEKRISRKDILEATGLNDTTVKRALRELQNQKFILTTRVQKGSQWMSNTYGLHPERYGKDILAEIRNKPTLKVIQGYKKRHSSEHMGTEVNPGVGTCDTPGVGTQETPHSGGNLTESLENRDGKNPLKEPMKELLSKIPESFTLLGKQNPEKRVQLDDPEAEKVRQLTEVKRLWESTQLTS